MRFLAAIAFVVLGSSAAVSVVHASPWHYGARIGGGQTNIHGDFPDIANPKYQASFTAGAFAEYDIVPSVSLGLEALYVTKGAKFEGFATDQFGQVVSTADGHLRLKYVVIPLLARVSLPRVGNATPYVVAGPSAGIGLSAKSEFSGQEADLSDDLQSPDYGVIGGVGGRIPSGSMTFGFEATYATSFNDLWDISNNLESINHGFSLTVSLAR